MVGTGTLARVGGAVRTTTCSAESRGQVTLEPGLVRLVAPASLPLTLEDRFGLRQHQRVRPPRASGLVPSRELVSVEAAVHVTPALLSERPFEDASCRVGEEAAEQGAQVAMAAAGRSIDQSLSGRGGRAGRVSSRPAQCLARSSSPAAGAGGLREHRGGSQCRHQTGEQVVALLPEQAHGLVTKLGVGDDGHALQHTESRSCQLGRHLVSSARRRHAPSRSTLSRSHRHEPSTDSFP